MGLFSNQDKEMKRQFKEQMSRQDESNEAQVAMQLNDRGNVAFEPQVSAMLLENDARMLDWREDYENNTRVLNPVDLGMNEPFGFEQLAFLDEHRGEKGFCGSSSQTLRAIRLHMAKYGSDDLGRRLFNDIAGAYQITLLLSRADGKPQKLAKSQYVESSSYIQRGVDGKGGKSEKLFGLF
jgi:hypothetical protein